MSVIIFKESNDTSQGTGLTLGLLGGGSNPICNKFCQDLKLQFRNACTITCPSLSAFVEGYNCSSVQSAVERSLLRFSASPSILQGRQAAAILSNFACVPVDRAKGELAVLCRHKYWQIGQHFLRSCNAVPVTLSEVINFNQHFFVWPNRLEVLPFCHLKLGREHHFGQLTLHVKAKSLFPLCDTWTSLKLRPLVSYRRHHWRTPSQHHMPGLELHPTICGAWIRHPVRHQFLQQA